MIIGSLLGYLKAHSNCDLSFIFFLVFINPIICANFTLEMVCIVNASTVRALWSSHCIFVVPANVLWSLDSWESVSWHDPKLVDRDWIWIFDIIAIDCVSLRLAISDCLGRGLDVSCVYASNGEALVDNTDADMVRHRQLWAFRNCYSLWNLEGRRSSLNADRLHPHAFGWSHFVERNRVCILHVQVLAPARTKFRIGTWESDKSLLLVTFKGFLIREFHRVTLWDHDRWHSKTPWKESFASHAHPPELRLQEHCIVIRIFTVHSKACWWSAAVRIGENSSHGRHPLVVLAHKSDEQVLVILGHSWILGWTSSRFFIHWLLGSLASIDMEIYVYMSATGPRPHSCKLFILCQISKFCDLSCFISETMVSLSELDHKLLACEVVLRVKYAAIVFSWPVSKDIRVAHCQRNWVVYIHVSRSWEATVHVNDWADW